MVLGGYLNARLCGRRLPVAPTEDREKQSDALRCSRMAMWMALIVTPLPLAGRRAWYQHAGTPADQDHGDWKATFDSHPDGAPLILLAHPQPRKKKRSITRLSPKLSSPDPQAHDLSASPLNCLDTVADEKTRRPFAIVFL